MRKINVLPVLSPLRHDEYKKQPRWWHVGLSALAFIVVPLGLAQCMS